MDATELQEAASLASESSALRARGCDMESRLRESEGEQTRLREENERPCARSPVPLLSAMKDFPTELMQRLIPADRAIMLGMVSKEMRAAMGRVKPAARVKAKQAAFRAAGAGEGAGQGTKNMMPSEGGSMVSARAPQSAVMEPISVLERGLGKLQEWCRVTALDLSAIAVGAKGAGRLAAVLPQCTSLAHLHLGYNNIGAEGAGLLAAVLPQCTSLAHLHLGGNLIGAEGAAWLQAAALPSLDLTF